MRGAMFCFLVISTLLFTSTPEMLAIAQSMPSVREIPESGGASLTVDGSLDDRSWRPADEIQLVPSETGVPAALNGAVKLIARSGYLCLSATLPEPGGRVLARSAGYNPVWEQDAPTSPLVEDLLIVNLTTGTVNGYHSTLRLEINPLGALRVERDGSPVAVTGILTAAAISSQGWNVECAIPLAELYQEAVSGDFELSLGRYRSRRPLDPAFSWKDAPGRFKLGKSSLTAKPSPPGYDPPQTGNTQPALRIGRVQAVPSLAIDDPFWKNVNGFSLLRNEPNPRRPEFPTEIKWVHDGKRLALLFACTEDSRVDCDTGSRDGNVASDDNVFVYLATSGSKFVEIQLNPVGTVRDALGRGPHMYRSSSGAWTGDVESDFLINSDAWYLRVNLPLDQIAEALGETAVPKQWKVLIGRTRQDRIGETEEISTNPVIANSYMLAPARYRSLVLTDQNPSNLDPDPESDARPKLSGLAAGLASSDSRVYSRVERKYLRITDMLERYLDDQVRTTAMQEYQQWEQVETLADWERFRDERIGKLKANLGPAPRVKCPLDYRVSGELSGDGYLVRNVVFQTRPGFYAAGNLYLPAEPAGKMPGIVIIPSHHYPKIQGELKDCGMVWARCGCAVLVLETMGYGERVEVVPWYRQPYQSESQLELQLNLVGQNRLGWIAWDVSRAADLLLEQGDVDPDKLILIGSVTWGGGRPAALAGALDKRFAAVVPFNWGRVYWESYGMPRSVVDQVTPWLTCAAIAPRKLLYAHEFSWEGEEGHALPSISVAAWPRYEKIYRLYGAEDNLRSAQGKGLLRVSATMGDCYTLGSKQRRPMYPIFKQWFDIPLPCQEDLNIEPDSWLTFGGIRQGLDVVRLKESMRRMPDTLLLSITPETDAKLERKSMHELAGDIAAGQLADARQKLESFSPEQRRETLARKIEAVLGAAGPATAAPECEILSKKTLAGAGIEAIDLRPEPGIMVPLLLLKPAAAAGKSCPVVVGLAGGGKDRFLKQRSGEIEKLLSGGIAVCLPDVRGTGETAPSQYNRSSFLSDRCLDLGVTLLGQRVGDVRAVLGYLRTRDDIDGERIALWGESFAQVNGGELWVHELLNWPIGPKVEYLASPLGAQLALYTALLEGDIRAVACRGALGSYRSLLESDVTYIPFDMVVPKVFEAGDNSDVCACLAPMPLLLQGAVDGLNRTLAGNSMADTFKQASAAYKAAGAPGKLTLHSAADKTDPADWLAAQLK